MRLTREVRCSVLPGDAAVTNSWAGWPAARYLAPFLRLRVTVRGDIDSETGYVCNIKQLDQLVRARAVPLMVDLYAQNRALSGEVLLDRVWEALCDGVPSATRLDTLRIALSPFLWVSRNCGAPDMISLTTSFEFSAAHRLYCPGLSARRNTELFGKCANPSGHGHNYQVQVTVSGAPQSDTGTVIELPRLESIIKEQVIDRFDHKHLNLDCPEFKDLNPSVEHITRVIWDLLHGQFAPARLTRVRVWETPKTCAEISA